VKASATGQIRATRVGSRRVTALSSAFGRNGVGQLPELLVIYISPRLERVWPEPIDGHGLRHRAGVTLFLWGIPEDRSLFHRWIDGEN
jgi:hypothetical protein